MDVTTWTWILVGLSFALYIGIALRSRAGSTKDFYVAGGGVPSVANGMGWSTSALALALDASQRTVQRALADLESAGHVRRVGRARAQRWLAPPLAGFTTILLLPAALPPG